LQLLKKVRSSKNHFVVLIWAFLLFVNSMPWRCQLKPLLLLRLPR
jgi:hypothetical protein